MENNDLFNNIFYKEPLIALYELYWIYYVDSRSGNDGLIYNRISFCMYMLLQLQQRNPVMWSVMALIN